MRTLNQLGYHDLEELRRPPGAVDRVAQAATVDDQEALARVVELLDRLGFDAVDAGPLASDRGLGPGTPAFGAAYGASALRALVTWSSAEDPVRTL